MQAVTGGAHVPRAVLATAAEFGDVPRSIAEYIWNSFQYRRDRTIPATVVIRFGRDKAGGWYEVEDFANGAGMDLTGLQRFFTMHAPNEDRLRGEAGRGRNGTGKAAAFGVGKVLEIYTVKNGIANEFRLAKDELLKLDSIYPCDSLPLEHVIIEQGVHPPTPQNGTKVRVSGLGLLVDEDATIRNLIRIFMRVLEYNTLIWEKSSGKRVRVIRERPPTVLNADYNTPTEYEPLIGQVVLHLFATEYDLPKTESGVIVTTVGGSVLESNFMDVVRRHAVVDKRIFGDIDVPLLDVPDSAGRLASTQARRLEMNRESDRVQALLTWLTDCIDDFRDKVVDQLTSTIDEREKAVLDAISGALEHVLNQEYEKFMRDYSTRMKLPKVEPTAPFPGTGAAGGARPSSTGEGQRVYVEAPDGSTKVIADPSGDIEIASPGTNEGAGGTAPGMGSTASGRIDDDGKPAVERRRGTKRAQGGRSLRVIYLGLGPTSLRAYFDGAGTFQINKDHPDFRGVDRGEVEFMRRSAEACAVAYAEAILEMRVDDADPTVAQPKDALNAYLDQHDRVLRPLIEVCPDS